MYFIYAIYNVFLNIRTYRISGKCIQHWSKWKIKYLTREWKFPKINFKTELKFSPVKNRTMWSFVFLYNMQEWVYSDFPRDI